MRKLSWRVGVFIISCSTFLRALATSNNFYFMTTQELIGAIIVGALLILPELIYQLVQFFSSKPKF
jgi:uncharacterized membrane protein